MSFQCLRCEDSCCRKKVVCLNNSDIRRLKLASDEYDFDGDIFDYVIFRGDIPQGKTVKGNKFDGVLTLKQVDGACVFFDDKKGCTIHRHKPMACQMYPYDPIFIEKKGTFDLYLKVDKSCPGLGETYGDYIPESALLYWREERLEYDKIVDKWNKREDKNLIKFVEMILNDAYDNN